MQTKKSIVIQFVFVAIFIVAFFMTWVKIGMFSVTGIDVPQLNTKLTKVSNLKYILTPSKKESTQIGYFLYLVPAFSILAGVIIITVRKMNLSKYLLFVTAILGVFFAIYVDISVIKSLKFSNIGTGSHLLLLSSLAYIVLFFTPLMKKSKDVEEKPLP